MAERASFDLVDEPWLPCVRRNGQRVDLGLRAALLEAHELREVFDPSPLATVALHRLLLAILHRAHLGPVDFAAWTDLWQAGRWDPAVVGDYLDQWRHRFDLFHPERPFYGVPPMDEGRDLPVTLLAIEAASGNNATLFDHSLNAAPVSLPAAVAARHLVARQAFSFGGGVSQPFNLTDSPLVRDYTVLAFGETLFETLTLNLLVYNHARPIPWMVTTNDDPPAWEQDTPRTPDAAGTPPFGYLDYLTWQSRRIHLLPEGDPPSVRWCQLQQNLKIADDPNRLDPFKAYVTSKEGGRRARKLDPDQAVWRDSHALFQHAAPDARRPELFTHLALLDAARQDDTLAAEPVYAFGVFGLATVPGRASVELWRQDRLPLPLAYLDDPALTAALGDALALAHEASVTLRRGLWALARLLLAPGADDPDASQPPKERVSALVEHFGAERPFWTALETAFLRLLLVLPNEARRGPDGEAIFAGEVRADWRQTLERTSRAAFEAVVTSLNDSGRTLKASVHARNRFEQELRERLPPAV